MNRPDTPKELSPKRKRMMDMILALGGLKEEQAIPASKVSEAIDNLKNELAPLVDDIIAFPGSYFTKFLSASKNLDLPSEIKNNSVLRDAISTLEATVEISTTDALQGLLKSLKTALEVSESAGTEKDAFGETLQEITSKINSDPEMALFLLQQNLGITTRYGQPPCHVECPAGVRTQRFVNLTRDKRFDEALELMRSTYPFAGTLGRVCNAPCESRCQRGLIDQPVSIRNLHRFLADNERAKSKKKTPTPSLDKEEKIAVIGAGPAGIGCAYDLLRMGYPVTIFESKPKNGGLLRYGIPSYRLPRDVLDEEISYVQQIGAEILNNQHITKPSELLTKGFSAVFVGTGASSSRKLRIDGEDAKGVFHALEFLDDINMGKKINLGKRVAVIGGGNAAIDSARVALRIGASEVSIVYRRSREEMPAIETEIEDAEHEGIVLKILSSPVKILTDGGKATGIQCIKMELGEPDASGRRRPVPMPNSEFDIEVDSIVVAIGQGIDADDYFSDLEYTEWGLIQADSKSFQTSVQGVFAGGDAVSGPATVVKAVGAGKKAAISIDQYLRGEPVSQEIPTYDAIVASVDADKAQAKGDQRATMPVLAPEIRATTFDEVELGFDKKMAPIEASRCINCSISNMDVTVYGGRIDPEASQPMMKKFLQDEVERGTILALVREKGALTSKDLTDKTGIPQDKVFLHLVQMKRNEDLVIVGEEHGYVLYDVLRTATEAEITLQTVTNTALQLATAQKELETLLSDLKAEDIGKLAGSLETFSRSRDKLSKVGLHGSVIAESILNEIEEKIRSAVLLAYRTRAKLPSTRPKVTVDELTDVDVPSVLEEYKSQMGYAPLLGFGTIEWTHSRCLGCKSCELECPEDAIKLTPVLRIPEIFEFADEDLAELPINRGLFYKTVQSLATTKPTDNIVLEKESPGFGSVEVDLWLCVACRTCVRRCPGPVDGALVLDLKWSLPEVVRQITSQT
ncbi:4Fe-4S dicluster domain-containing protein [Candidatus Thorarchaeota archaeon]|nr:MAG: 4Fe-4S dicluster domain-containing protein [Candidatus Thorarchaeota archaeon]